MSHASLDDILRPKTCDCKCDCECECAWAKRIAAAAKMAPGTFSPERLRKYLAYVARSLTMTNNTGRRKGLAGGGKELETKLVSSSLWFSGSPQPISLLFHAQGVNVSRSINMSLVSSELGLMPQCFHGEWPRYCAERLCKRATDVNFETIKGLSHSKQEPSKLQAKKDLSKSVRDDNLVGHVCASPPSIPCNVIGSDTIVLFR